MPVAAQMARHQGDVDLLHGPLLELAGQRRAGKAIARHHHHARGILVQPMDNARPPTAVQLHHGGKVGKARDQRVDQGGMRMPGRGMHRHARRLVDEDHVRIFVQYLYIGCGRRRGCRRDGRRDLELDPVAGMNRIGGARRPLIHHHQPGLNRLGDLGTRIFRRQFARQIRIQPHPARRMCNQRLFCSLAHVWLRERARVRVLMHFKDYAAVCADLLSPPDTAPDERLRRRRFWPPESRSSRCHRGLRAGIFWRTVRSGNGPTSRKRH